MNDSVLRVLSDISEYSELKKQTYNIEYILHELRYPFDLLMSPQTKWSYRWCVRVCSRWYKTTLYIIGVNTVL